MTDSQLAGIEHIAAISGPGEQKWLRETVRTLIAEIRQQRGIIESLKTGDCWCELGIDNPMMSGGHSAECEAAQRAMES